MNTETALVECKFTAEQQALVNEILATRDLYSIVGARRSDSMAAIRKSYRQRALEVHPDKNHAPGAEDAFKMLTNAVAILSDREKREYYDFLNYEDDSDDDDRWYVEMWNEQMEERHRKALIKTIQYLAIILYMASLMRHLFDSTPIESGNFTENI